MPYFFGSFMVSDSFFWNLIYITNSVILNKTCINQMTNASTIVTCLV